MCPRGGVSGDQRVYGGSRIGTVDVDPPQPGPAADRAGHDYVPQPAGVVVDYLGAHHDPVYDDVGAGSADDGR
jgi:hypothetical protein